MIIYYVRHGDPIYNPSSLTPLGKRQAEAVARRLAAHGIDEIYSSTSNRAVETATPLSEIVKKPINMLEWCSETLAWNDLSVINDNGKLDWIFRDKDTIKKFTEKSILDARNKWYLDPFFDKKVGIGICRIDDAVDDFMSGFGYCHNRERGVYEINNGSDKRIALFAHQGFGLAFLSSILDIPYPVFSTHFDISHSCVSVIYFPYTDHGESIPKLLQHSNDSHLYKDGLPTLFNNELLI